MKKSLLVLAGVLAMSSVAFAMDNGNTTTSTSCDASGAQSASVPTAAPTCSVQGQTLLQAVEPEGLTLTVPNEIDFTIVPGMLNIGNKPLTALTTWNLADAGTSFGYTQVLVDSWFAIDDPAGVAMQATDGSTSAVYVNQIVGQIGNSGPQVAFGAATPYNTYVLGSAAAFPVYSVPVGADGIGTYTADVNLYIDARSVTPPVLSSPTAVYQGIVYTTAAAI
ncbi:MAG: hypothetical protein FWD64_04415 [Acidobacteriaceae bacterium]|nr:hypothetical protein [Acidobacteriaceae bacterium]